MNMASDATAEALPPLKMRRSFMAVNEGEVLEGNVPIPKEKANLEASKKKGGKNAEKAAELYFSQIEGLITYIETRSFGLRATKKRKSELTVHEEQLHKERVKEMLNAVKSAGAALDASLIVED